MKLRPLTEREWRILRFVGFPLFYLVCLFVFVRLTFPYDTLKERAVAEFNGRGGEKRLEIDDMSGHWLFGLDAEGVRLTDIAAPPASPDEKVAPSTLYLDRLRVSPSVWSFLFGNKQVSFDADVGGGTIEGSFFQSDAEARISVKGAGVDIAGLTLLSAGIGLPLGGTLGGEVELLLPEGKMTAAEGKFDLVIEGLTVGDGQAKVRGTIALPKLSAGNFTLKGEATEGRLDIAEFGSDGKDIEISATGKVRLREPFDKSTSDLDVGFRFKEAYTNKNDLTKSLFGSSDSKIPALFDMDPNVRRAKDAEGFYRWRVTGLLTRPSFRPGASRSRGKPEKPEKSGKSAAKGPPEDE